MSDTWNESRKGQITMSRRIFGTSYVDVYDNRGWTNILATHDEDSAFEEFSRQLEANGRAARLRSRSGFRTFMSVMSGLTALLCLVLFLIYATALMNGPKDIGSVTELLIWIALTALWTVFAVHLTRPVTLLCAVRTEDDDEPVRTKGMEIGLHKVATGTPFPRTEGIPASAKISSHTSDSEATTVISPHPLDGDGQTRSAVTQSGTSYMVMSGDSLSKLVNGLQETQTIPTYTSAPVEEETPSETPSNVSEDDSTEEPAEKVEQPVVPSGSASLVFDDTAEHPVVTDDHADDPTEEPETEQDEPEPEQESAEEPIEESTDESTDEESIEDEPHDELLFRKRRRVIYKGDLPKRQERLRRYIHSITQEDDGTWTVVYTDVDNVDNSDTKGELWDAIRDRVERIDGVMNNG